MVSEQDKNTSLAPPGWGEDSITDFFELAQQNRFATYLQKHPLHENLCKIDNCFERVSNNLIGHKNILAALFFVRAHSAYRAGCSLAYSTQIPESYNLLRSCLEYSGYALVILDNQALSEVFLKRHDSKEYASEVRKNFSSKKFLDAIKSKDYILHEVCNKLYNGAIEAGAHPNVNGIVSALRIEKSDEKTVLNPSYFHGDSLTLDFALASCAQFGIASLFIFQFIWPEKFQLLGVTEELFFLKKWFKLTND